MHTRFPEYGRTALLLKAQDEDLAIATELMRERTNLEQAFIKGLQALVEKHKPQPNDENREYTNVLINAFEQEIEARIVCKLDVPKHLPIGEKLPTGSTAIQRLQDTHQRHEEAYAALLASKDELQKWKGKENYWDLKGSRMPLVELRYRWSVYHQRQSAKSLLEWYETTLSPLVESHHSALEDTKTTMIRTMNANIDCASTCSRIYSRALERASGLLPLNHRASIEERLEAEMNSYALRPVDYCNWFYDGQPSPLLFGIGTMDIDPKIVAEWVYFWSLDWEDRLACLQAERENDLSKVSAKCVTRFELLQYCPLLPLNSSEYERLGPAKTISRRDLPALLSPDDSVWDPLGSTRRKDLLKMTIARAGSHWLTFLPDSENILEAVRRKWDFENDRPKPK